MARGLAGARGRRGLGMTWPAGVGGEEGEGQGGRHAPAQRRGIQRDGLAERSSRSGRLLVLFFPYQSHPQSQFSNLSLNPQLKSHPNLILPVAMLGDLYIKGHNTSMGNPQSAVAVACDTPIGHLELGSYLSKKRWVSGTGSDGKGQCGASG